jgi:peptide chain release factor 1
VRPRGGFEVDLVERRRGLVVIRVNGSDAEAAFRDEAGGHRWQRVPPNERHGRVHTSTITVAVLREPTELELHIDPRDLEWSFSRGSGPGGQHRNKTESAVDLVHVPTGTVVHCESERSQQENKRLALGALRARILAVERDRDRKERGAARKDQIGSGMRGDKRRTIRCQEGTVTDHVTGRTWRLREYLRGE